MPRWSSARAHIEYIENLEREFVDTIRQKDNLLEENEILAAEKDEAINQLNEYRARATMNQPIWTRTII